jgi:serine/threonine protein kinase/Tol biopolymer transport system component
MTLAAHTRLGPYEILSPLGAGGMGEVYRARDTRLDRQVAVKVLPARLFDDAQALSRFEREAKMVAALSHPNILALYDVGKEGTSVFAVTELLAGETLRERLRDGPLPMRKALEWARQITDGLAAAHEKGVVHRDLKPENLFVTNEGRVKILDFGLARESPRATGDGASNSPTVSRLTGPGVVMGTVGYMSPEQVRGSPIDHRADLFSLGVVLYETLSGRRPFDRETEAETLTAILREDVPELAELSGGVPPALGYLVHRCLEKGPDERFDTAHDVGLALEAVQRTTAPPEARVEATKRTPSRWWLFAAGLALGALVGVVVLWPGAGRPPPEAPTLRHVTHSGFDSAPSASPDGRMVVFQSTRDGQPRIWLKQLEGGGETVLTEGPDDLPRFSPDGSTVLFVRTGEDVSSLYRVPLLGGDARKLVEDATEGDWSPDGRQVAFIRWKEERGRRTSAIGLVNADGTGAREITRVPRRSLRGVRWDPDGRRIAAITGGFASGEPIPGIFIVDPSGDTPRAISPPGTYGLLSSVAWSAGGEALLFSQASSALGDLVGSPAQIFRYEIRARAARTLLWTPHNATTLDVLGPGRLVFDACSPRVNLRELALRGAGSPRPRWLSRGTSTDRQPFYSPDGEWVLFVSNRGGNADIWEISTESGTLRRLTDSPADEFDPIVSADGRTLAFGSEQVGYSEVWIAERDGSNPRQVTRDGVAENGTLTPDGQWLVYASGDPERAGIWKVRRDGSEATLLVAGKLIVPEVSPDGEHVLFVARPGSREPVIRVVRVADGIAVPFEIPVRMYRPTLLVLGRARWMPDGTAIAFVGQDEDGVDGVFVQDFVPEGDTTRTRRRLGGFDPERTTDSFAISPDGSRMTIAVAEQLRSIVVAEGLQQVEPPVRRR